MSVTSQNKEKFEDYDGFVEKFKPKKTTDDCYTPTLVYDAVADWTAREYGLDRADFIRPFYPGGDYLSFDYTGKIVVDNPPFSCLSKIIDFYVENWVSGRHIRVSISPLTMSAPARAVARLCMAGSRWNDGDLSFHKAGGAGHDE